MSKKKTLNRRDLFLQPNPWFSLALGVGSEKAEGARFGQKSQWFRVACRQVVSFQLNNSGKNVLRFQFPETLPAPLSDCLQQLV